MAKKQGENTEDNKPLNDKQKAFCREYVRDWNGKRAYMAAYPDAKEKSAEAAASRLLSNVKVQEHIEYLKGNIEELLGISKAKVVEEYVKMVFGTEEDGYKDISTADKQKALQEISRMMGYNKPEEGVFQVIHQITGMVVK